MGSRGRRAFIAGNLDFAGRPTTNYVTMTRRRRNRPVATVRSSGEEKSSSQPGTEVPEPTSVPPPTSRGIVLGGWMVFGVALAIRLAHWWFVRRNDPLYDLTLPETDMHTYWEWAKSIAAGDWLSRKQGGFYYGPLYPYWLAPWFAAFGPRFELVHGLQALLGTLPPVLVWSIGRNLFNPTAGLAAGLLLALCAPLLFYEQLILMEGLLVAIHAGFLWCLAKGVLARSGRSWLYAAGAGLLAGLACLGRGNFQLVALLFVPGWYVATRLADRSSEKEQSVPCDQQQPSQAASPKRAWRHVTAYTLALSVVLSASMVRNGIIGGQWVLTTSNGPILLYIGNAPDSMGVFHYPDSFFALERKYGDRAAIPWMRELGAGILREPASFLLNLARKTWMFFANYEIADNASYYLFGRFSPLVRVNPLEWAPLLALGLLGLLMTRAQWRRQSFLYFYAVSFAISIIVVFVVGRYRLEFLLPMALWGGAALAQAWRWLQEQRWRPLAIFCGALAVLNLLLAARWSPAAEINTPPGMPGVRLIRPNDFGLLARAYFEKNDRDKAREVLAEGFAIHPWDQALARSLALMLEGEGQVEHAVAILRRYLTNMPHDAELVVELARMFARSERWNESEHLLKRVVDAQPDNEKARRLLLQVREQRKATDAPR